METLHTLINSLDAAEQKTLQQFINISGAKAQSKTLALAKFLWKKKKIPTHKECVKHIYGTKKEGKKFEMLKLRLKNKIYDSLLLDVNLSRNTVIDEADAAAVAVRKKTALIHQLYFAKGMSAAVDELMNEIISMSKEYEYFSGVLQAMNFKKYLSGFREGEKQFDDLNKEIAFYEYCYSSLKKASDYYYILAIKDTFSSEHDISHMVEFLKPAITELRKEYDDTKSEVVNHYCKYLEVEYYSLLENYSKARSVCLELLNIVRSNKAVYRKQRIGSVYADLSRIELYLCNYTNATETAVHAQKHFIPGSANFTIAQEQEFYALFYSKQYDDALRVSEEMLKVVHRETGDFRYSKYCYLNACALFATMDYKTAYGILNQKSELSQDKVGWEIGVRILNIMTCIELGELDEASCKVEALRKYIEYNGKKNKVNERMKLIKAYLSLLDAKGFVFNQLEGSAKKIMEKLSSKEEQYKWEILSAELIPFHEWAAGQVSAKLTR